MWLQTRREVQRIKFTRGNLEAMSKVVLEELGKISQEEIHKDNRIRYELYRDTNNDIYFVSPGFSVIFRFHISKSSLSAKKAKIVDVPSPALEKLLEISN